MRCHLGIMVSMPGMTFRMDEVEHKMLQVLSLKTGRSQNQILLDLLQDEFARHGITREQTQALLDDPNRLWSALGQQPPVVPAEVHDQVLRDLASLDRDSSAGGRLAA